MPSSPVSAKKRVQNDENVFSGTFETPPAKRPRRSLPKLSREELLEQQRILVEQRKQEELGKKAANREQEQEAERAAAQEANEADARRLKAVLAGIKADHGFDNLADFLKRLFATEDPHLSSQITKLIDNHGPELLTAMQARSGVVNEWVVDQTLKTVAEEGKKLAKALRPCEGQLTTLLETWSLEGVLEEAKRTAPTIYLLLQAAGTHPDQGKKRKDRDIIFTTVVCMLAQAYSERSNELQTVLCIYLFACGASQSHFAVLNHAGLTSSYSKALLDIKQLRDEQLSKILKIAKTRAFMIVWDNLNFAFKVSEQRLDSKDHFDNGTTATLIPLYDVAFGELTLDMNPPRLTRLNSLDFEPTDLFPSPVQIQQLEAAMLWHVENFLFDRFPALRAQLGDQIPPIPTVEQIPLHKTEQYPLPAMHIDESSLDGTLEVLETIIQKVLAMSESNVKEHGIIICAGDQLTNSLHDKSCACRRDDTELMDNVGCYTRPQLGLFHAKLAATRMSLNEHWGIPNSKALWSLWRMNTMLGRKAIAAGWKSKKLPPFRPGRELMQRLVLPANILDGFRIYCSCSSLEEWASKVEGIEDVHHVARQVRDQLCSSLRVSQLRALPDAERDVTLENIILFNRDALILEEFFHAIKRGDIGSVVNILAFWIHSFRGTGAMPKYADAVFEVIISLKQMDPKLRRAYMMNWLVNLSGLPNGHKEIDLLQEHQNFWAKIIYVARGSNRSWRWLSMITVSIFILRDVIRRVRSSFKTPHNGNSHTSPATDKEIQQLDDYLFKNEIQTYVPSREGGEYAVPVRDLFTDGVAYMNTASAFRNFKRYRSRVRYKLQSGAGDTQAHESDDENDPEEEDEDLTHVERADREMGRPTFEDLQDDDEEYFGEDLADMVQQCHEFVQILSQYD